MREIGREEGVVKFLAKRITGIKKEEDTDPGLRLPTSCFGPGRQ